MITDSYIGARCFVEQLPVFCCRYSRVIIPRRFHQLLKNRDKGIGLNLKFVFEKIIAQFRLPFLVLLSLEF